MKKVKNLKLRLGALALATSSMFTLCSCSEIGRELAAQETYDIVQQSENNGSDLSTGLKQILNVDGHDFKLVTEYSCDDESKREWRITSDKFLYIKVYTEGLPEGTEVFIDNVHIDTYTKSKYALMDGILQDSMDDRVHSSQLIGFPISDTISYFGVNAIEGCNETFIKGSYYGMYSYSSGSVAQRRYTEKDYLDKGVYANKIQIVYDLLIKGPNDKDFANVSVPTDFIVLVTNTEVSYEFSDGSVSNQKVKTK